MKVFSHEYVLIIKSLRVILHHIYHSFSIYFRMTFLAEN